MGDFYCDICDKTIKLEHKKKHIKAKSHMDLTESVINNSCVKNPQFIDS